MKMMMKTMRMMRDFDEDRRWTSNEQSGVKVVLIGFATTKDFRSNAIDKSLPMMTYLNKIEEKCISIQFCYHGFHILGTRRQTERTRQAGR